MNAFSPDCSRSAHFAETWEAWACFHHFLPADLFRELLVAIVPEISQGTFRFDELFEESMIGEPGAFATWSVQPKMVTSDLARFIQGQIRGLTWMNDTLLELHTEDAQTPGTLALNAALSLAQIDLNIDEHWVERIQAHCRQPAFKSVVSALNALRSAPRHARDEATLELLAVQFSELPSPLNLLLLKHAGDLLADVDQWLAAQALYVEAGRRLSEVPQVWNELTSLLQTLVDQSLAAAMYVIEGPRESGKFLNSHLESKSFAEFPLTHCNATSDAIVAGYMSVPPELNVDRRPAWMAPPLLIDSHDSGGALRADSSGKVDTAHRLFWAILRRQFALGSSTERKQTQMLYSKSLFRASAKNQSAELFRMAALLLLDSGDYKAVERIEWNEDSSSGLVNLELIELLIQKQRQYKGAEVERGAVLIPLFAQWIIKADESPADLVVRMLDHIVQLGKTGNSSPYAWADLVSPCIAALKLVARMRPEFGRIGASIVAEFILTVLASASQRYWTSVSGALELAQDYIDLLKPAEQRVVLAGVINLLRDQGGNVVWTIVDPALALLYSGASYTACVEDPSLGARIVETVVQYGVNREREQAQFLANFQHFPAELLNVDLIRSKLDSVIQSVCAGINSGSSAAVGKIQALLLVPELVGTTKIHDSVYALHGLLAQVTTPARSYLMVECYNAIRTLAFQIRRGKISKDKGMNAQCVALFETLMQIWSIAVDKPQIMTSFSIPEKTKPDNAIVHNWALATLEFGEALGRVSEASDILQAARGEATLDIGIGMAQGTLFAGRSSEGPVAVDVSLLQANTKDLFYSSLGRYLLVVANAGKDSLNLLETLIDQVLKFGPREADVGILLTALQQQFPMLDKGVSFTNYTIRALENPQTRPLLQPILSQLSRPIVH